MTAYLQTNIDLNAPEVINMLDELQFWSAPFGIKLLEHIHYRKGIQALDIGFGAGFPLVEIAMRLGTSSKVYGVDPWEAAVDKARQRSEFYSISNIEIILGVAENIPLESYSIDLITSNNGLNNVQDLNQSIKECARLLKAGGQFVQTINLNKTFIEFYAVMEEVLSEKGMNSSIAKMNEQINVKRKPLQEYLDLISSHGFEIRQVLEDNFNYRFADGTALLNHYFFRLAFMDGWKSVIPEENQKELFQLMEEKMNTMAEKQGGFKVSVPFVLIDAVKSEV